MSILFINVLLIQPAQAFNSANEIQLGSKLIEDQDFEGSVPFSTSSGVTSSAEEEVDDDDTNSRESSYNTYLHPNRFHHLLNESYSFTYDTLNLDVVTPPPRVSAV